MQDDPFSDATWAMGQYRLDWDKCRSLELSQGFATIWPTFPDREKPNTGPGNHEPDHEHEEEDDFEEEGYAP